MKFAVIDLECTDLKSDKGFLLCGGIKPLCEPGQIIGIKDFGPGPSRARIDRKLAGALKREIEAYDGIITWNGIMFDVPFLNDRLLLNGYRPLKQLFHIDIMYQARQGKAALTSSRLDWVAKMLKCPYRKTELDLSLWKEAEAAAIRHNGVWKEYNQIVEHCKWDLEVTEWVYEKLKPRVRLIQRR
jgi:uncharacterized protein YprB with RNaseH-like and TPR domain